VKGIDDRLERARDDYRSLVLPEAGASPAVGSPRRPTALVASVAAVMVLLAGVAVITLARRGDDAGTSRVRTPVASSDTTPAEEGDPEVSVVPSGPYTDGQAVTLRVDPDLGVDLWNGVPLCVGIQLDGRPVETCESVSGASVDDGGVTVEVRRRGISVDGARDCADDGVDCRFVLATAAGRELRSQRLRFVGPDPTGFATLRATRRSAGRFLLEPGGLEVDPSWTDYRRRFPVEAAGNGPFWVSVCATGGQFEPPPDPFGVDRHLWGAAPTTPGGEVCDSRGAPVTLDPDRPNQPVEIQVPRLLYGYGGWADCAVDQCFVVISTNIVVYADGQSSGWDARRTASVTLPRTGEWPPAERPTMRVLTGGPHRSGDEVELEVTGLGEGETRAVGTCHVAAPWGCSYSGTAVGNGRHRIVLPVTVGTCSPRSCYLELDASMEGLPPIATAPLDTP
jgi:hypothetical protein